MARPVTKDKNLKKINIELKPDYVTKLRVRMLKNGFTQLKPYLEYIINKSK